MGELQDRRDANAPLRRRAWLALGVMFVLMFIFVPRPGEESQAGGPGAPGEEQQVGRFVVSALGEVYHRPSCRYVKQMDSDNRMRLSSGDARDMGYRRCKICKP